MSMSTLEIVYPFFFNYSMSLIILKPYTKKTYMYSCKHIMILVLPVRWPSTVLYLITINSILRDSSEVIKGGGGSQWTIILEGTKIWPTTPQQGHLFLERTCEYILLYMMHLKYIELFKSNWRRVLQIWQNYGEDKPILITAGRGIQIRKE